MTKRSSSTILSCFIWGSGQFFICKQKLKGLLFFLAQVIFLGIEFFTGYWLNYFTGEVPNFQIRIIGGFFTHGIWGLKTLGAVAGGINGDHSGLLLINGLISLFALLIFIAIYVWNIKDAYSTGKLIDSGNIQLSSLEYGKNLYNKMFPYVVLTPIIVLIIFVILMPIVFSVLTAFTNYDINHLPPGSLFRWVGLRNFTKIFSMPIWTKTFTSVLIWNIIWAVTATFTTYFFGLFQALILNSKGIKGKKIFQAIYILPWAIPAMVSLLMFRNLLNGQFGPLNQFLMHAGLIHQRIEFLSNPTYAKISIILVNLWLGFPPFLVLNLGVLSNQDTSLYEAAQIDGANKFQVFHFIKLPILLKATAPLIIMNFATNFNLFGQIYFLTNGGPPNPKFEFAGDTDILISWIYKLTLNQKLYSMAGVMNILIFVLIAVVAVWNMKRTTAFKEM